jgi:hypothetical protein
MAWVVACGCGDGAAPEILGSTGSSGGESSSSSTGEPGPLMPTDDADNLPGYADANDWNFRSEAAGDFDYVVRIVEQGAADELPADWQYKPDVTSSRYNKYADAGPSRPRGRRIMLICCGAGCTWATG